MLTIDRLDPVFPAIDAPFGEDLRRTPAAQPYASSANAFTDATAYTLLGQIGGAVGSSVYEAELSAPGAPQRR